MVAQVEIANLKLRREVRFDCARCSLSVFVVASEKEGRKVLKESQVLRRRERERPDIGQTKGDKRVSECVCVPTVVVCTCALHQCKCDP